MTRPSGFHLSPEEIDACLAGVSTPESQHHLDQCQTCLELVRAEREIVDLIGTLPPMSPSEGFADRVMAFVVIPDPFAIRSLHAARRRLLATPRSLAFAAGLALFLLASMAGSIAWSLSHEETLASIGTWVLSQSAQALWLGVRGLASNIIEQPWYEGIRSLVENPTRLALISALGSLMYVGGVFALRRLLAVPTQQVAHARI
jgi:hypothetical protein